MKQEGLSSGGMYFTDPEVLFSFMRRTRKPVWHKSNVHFRDIQHAIRDYMETVEREPISMPQAERIAGEIVELYAKRGVLRNVSNQAYTLNMPEFATTADGTYAMLTIHGAPIRGEAEQALEIATEGMADAVGIAEELGKPKGGDVSAEGNRIAELVLPIAPPKNAEPGHIGISDHADLGAPQEPRKDPQAGTDNKPNPKVEKHLPQKPKIAPPPWMKKN